MKPKLFVGSSVEGVAIANAVHENLRYQAEVTVWDQGIFRLSEYALDSLIKALSRMDFGAFVFSPDDMVTMRGEQNRAIRDNVLFELGLFVGRLGKDRSFILMPQGLKDLHLPTDLIGITPGTYEIDREDGNLQAATGPACSQIRQSINKLGSLSSNNIPQAPQSSDRDIKSRTDDAEHAQAEEVKTIEESTPQELDWLTLFFAGKYKEAISALEKAIEATEDESEKIDLKSWIGRAIAKTDFNKGLEYLNKLREENPESDEPYSGIAYANKEAGFIDKALETLDMGISSAKNKGWLKYFKATYLESESRIDEALVVLNELIASLPEFIYSYEMAAQILKDQGKNNESKSMYEAGLKISPNDPGLLYNYGRLLLEVGNDEAALIVFRKLNKLFPQESVYLSYLGNAYLSLELNGISLEAYQKANELADGKQAWIIANIGNIFNNQGFYPQAIEYLKKALELDTDSDYAHERLASAIKKAKEERNKADEIIRKYQQSIMQPENSTENSSKD